MYCSLFFSNDEDTTSLILACFQTFIQLCGMMDMTVPRDAFLTALSKASLPPKFAMSLITSHRASRSGGQEHTSSENRGALASDPVISGRVKGGGEGGGAVGGAKKKLSFPSGEGVSGGGGGGGGGEGGGGGGGKATTPVSSQKAGQSTAVMCYLSHTYCM